MNAMNKIGWVLLGALAVGGCWFMVREPDIKKIQSETRLLDMESRLVALERQLNEAEQDLGVLFTNATAHDDFHSSLFVMVKHLNRLSTSQQQRLAELETRLPPRR